MCVYGWGCYNHFFAYLDVCFIVICTNHSYDLYSKAMTDLDANGWSVVHHAVDVATYCTRAHIAARQLIPRCPATILNSRTTARHAYLPHNYSCLGLVSSSSDKERAATDIAQLLIENRAEVNSRASGGNTALILAAGSGQADMVRCLANNGANVNATKINGKGALQVSCRSSSTVRKAVSKAGGMSTHSLSSGRLHAPGFRKTGQTLRAVRRGTGELDHSQLAHPDVQSRGEGLGFLTHESEGQSLAERSRSRPKPSTWPVRPPAPMPDSIRCDQQ